MQRQRANPNFRPIWPGPHRSHSFEGIIEATKMDIAGRLKEYTKTHVETISKEYYTQTLKWKAYLNLAADAQTNAREHVQSILEEIKRKQAEADQLMLMAFSFVGIAGAS